MQNVREYIEVKLHTTANGAMKAASNHTFENFSVIDKNLVQTNHFQPAIIHSTPLAIGVTILELVCIDIDTLLSPYLFCKVYIHNFNFNIFSEQTNYV